ncbi:C-type lectin domain family 12 member A-like [Dipodomys merriami]|uniref:C-type lectin domain family 12 member A-like n=1 Tax=Dipodomys merriami TaxID=94247 RepID=UPI003855A265
MSEEVTSAGLTFHDTRNREKIPEFENMETKANRADPSPVWVRTALRVTLLLLLLLFIGLRILWIMIYKLQNVQEELQRNMCLHQIGNVNSSEKIQNLYEKIQNLAEKIQNQSITLQTLATRLCRELQEKERGHKCKPCPQDWIWHANRCYRLYHTYDTWKNSQKSCAHHNASLLMINNKDARDFVKSLVYNYWIGASPRQALRNDYVKVDDSIMSDIWLKSNLTDLNKRYCGYLSRGYIDYTLCSEQKYAICEKMAGPVQVESVLVKIQDERLYLVKESLA